MGFYLNSTKSLTMYRNETGKPYFADKSMMLEEICPLTEQGIAENNTWLKRLERFADASRLEIVLARDILQDICGNINRRKSKCRTV